MYEEKVDLSRWEPVIHKGWQIDRVQSAINKRPCEKVAFYVSKAVELNWQVRDEDFLSVEGEQIKIVSTYLDFTPCPICGNPIRNADIVRAINRLNGLNNIEQ